jgi:hypothetical protein
MPESRPADFYLGYLDGCIFLDFDNVDNKICLTRISFDGYGCCILGDRAIPMTAEDSASFKDIVQAEVKDQVRLEAIVRRTISVNKAFIWPDALEKYGLN